LLSHHIEVALMVSENGTDQRHFYFARCRILPGRYPLRNSCVARIHLNLRLIPSMSVA
jgi:hypothetical protein